LLWFGLLYHTFGGLTNFYYILTCLCSEIRTLKICLDNWSPKNYDFTTVYVVDFGRL
jgi:hypothetical protein